MTTITFIHNSDSEQMASQIELDKIVTAMQLIMEGEDKVFDSFISNMSTSQQALLDAMSWEQDKTIKSYLDALQTGGRFAIHGKDCLLAASALSHGDALVALNNGEF